MAAILPVWDGYRTRLIVLLARRASSFGMTPVTSPENHGTSDPYFLVLCINGSSAYKNDCDSEVAIIHGKQSEAAVANNVVRFIIRARDLSRLRSFYEAVFDWQFYDVAPDYLSLETYPHDHDDAGNDISPPVLLDTKHGAVLWRHESEPGDGRVFVAGIPEGGLGAGDPGVMVFVEVEDIEKSLAAVEAHEGTAMGSPLEIPGFARVAGFRDPEGNMVGLQQPVSTA
jgi:predicted enzyme related to lactoylglutathione lyase